MRRKEIDWIRNICILMLFIYHTSAIFTDFGDFYIKTEKSKVTESKYGTKSYNYDQKSNAKQKLRIRQKTKRKTKRKLKIRLKIKRKIKRKILRLIF